MKISFNCLDVNSINNAISELDNIRSRLDRLSEKIISEVIERAKQYAIDNLNLASSVSNEMAKEVANTIPTITTEFVKPNVAIIRAGGDAIWLEFGSGVHYNGAPGSFPHPKAQDVEGIFPIGQYNQGMDTEGNISTFSKGANDYWVYYDTASDSFKTSHGTQCTQFMYQALLQVQNEIPKIVEGILK